MAAEKIKTARMAAGLTQEKAATLLQFPLRTWQKWEEGTAQPPVYIEKLILDRLTRMQEK